jgi:hypothetical protein
MIGHPALNGQIMNGRRPSEEAIQRVGWKVLDVGSRRRRLRYGRVLFPLAEIRGTWNAVQDLTIRREADGTDF